MPTDARIESPDAHASPKAARRRSIAWAQGIAFILGALLLWWFVRRVGVQPVFTALSRVGFGFFIVVGLNGLRHVLRTLSMRIFVPPAHWRLPVILGVGPALCGE